MLVSRSSGFANLVAESVNDIDKFSLGPRSKEEQPAAVPCLNCNSISVRLGDGYLESKTEMLLSDTSWRTI